MKYAWLLVLACLPHTAFASVMISEIAWMGSTVSSSDEWIELCNTSGDASLDGWKLTSTDGGLSILLSGSISENGCYVIERTDDTTIPHRTAELVASFGSGLSNSGEVIQLVDVNQQVVDEVDGSLNWKNIGGNSTTRETAQKNGDIWVTAVATPGEKLEAAPEEDSTVLLTGATSTTTSLSGSSSYRPGNRNTYKLEVIADSVVPFGATANFEARVFDGNGHSVDQPKITWNLGDGFTAEGKKVEHVYQFLGTYTLYIAMEYRGKRESVEKRIEVRAGDVRIADAKEGERGYIAIESKNLIDISGWRVRSLGLVYEFPEHTVLQAKIPLRFPNMYTGITTHSTLSLERPDGLISSTLSLEGDSERTISSKEGALYSFVLPNRNTVVNATPSASMTPVAVAYANDQQKDNGAQDGKMKYAGAGLFLLVSALLVTYLTRVFNPNREIEEEASKFALVEMESNLDSK